MQLLGEKRFEMILLTIGENLLVLSPPLPPPHPSIGLRSIFSSPAQSVFHTEVRVILLSHQSGPAASLLRTPLRLPSRAE